MLLPLQPPGHSPTISVAFPATRAVLANKAVAIEYYRGLSESTNNSMRAISAVLW